MDKQKNLSKKLRSVAITVMTIICLIGLLLLWLDAFTYWNTIKISNKEEMFQFVIDNQEELDQVVYEMESQYEASDDKVVILYKNEWELRDLPNVNKLFKKFSASNISINYIDKVKGINISFSCVPKGYDYWGIYHSKTGEAADWGEGELIEQDGVYVQVGSYYKYETEKIVGNWYYYQCDTR